MPVNILPRKLVFTLLALGLSACGGPVARPKIDRGATQGADALPADDGETDQGKEDEDDKLPPGPGSENQADPKLSLNFFTQNVLPLFKAAPCSNCHNIPQDITIIDGGLTIQNHNLMLAKLKQNAVSASDNSLINKLQSKAPDTHSGGAVCADANAPLCSMIQEWFKIAVGTDGAGGGTPAAEGDLGNVEFISRTGNFSGWAGLKAEPTTVLKVRFYLDGDNASGTRLSEVSADLAAFDNQIEGDHAFSSALDPALIDGKPHKIYAYAVRDGQEIVLSANSPYSITAYKPKGQDKAPAFARIGIIVNGQVRQPCSSCHSYFSYDAFWGNMVNDAAGKAEWNATVNSLYTKATEGHLPNGAGRNVNICASIKCDEIKNWFTEEFGF